MDKKRSKFVGVLIIIISNILITSYSTKKQVIDLNLIKEEIKFFVSKAKSASVCNGKYNIYALKFTLEKNDYCITLGYISGPIDLKYVKSYKHYLKLDSELIIVNFPEKFFKKYSIINNNIQPLKDRKIINEKISKEPLLGTHYGYLLCYYNNSYKKLFYDSDEFIPSNKSIIKRENFKGRVRELDSSTFNSTLGVDLEKK